MTLQELDVLVRDLVLGKPDPTRCEWCGWPLKEAVEDGCIKDNCSMRPLPRKRFTDPAPYSTDMAHANTIFEKLKTPKNRKDWLAIEYREKLWTVGYKTIDDKGVIWRTGYSGTAETLPEAICLAAVNIYLAHKVHYNLAPEPAKESHA